MREFEQVIRAADPSIRFVIARLVGGDTDDVLQAAYLKAFRAWSGFRGESSASTWLHRIAYTTAIDHLRQRQRRPMTVNDEGALADDHPVADIESRVAQHLDLAAGLAALSADQRAVLLLVDAQGFSHADAASVLGVPSGHVSLPTVRTARNAMRARWMRDAIVPLGTPSTDAASAWLKPWASTSSNTARWSALSAARPAARSRCWTALDAMSASRRSSASASASVTVTGRRCRWRRWSIAGV